MANNSEIQKLFVDKYSLVGKEKFYNFLITYAINRVPYINKDINPAIELIEYYEMFLKLYRKDGQETNLELAKQFRKAANKIYRIILKQGLVEKNLKFFNVVPK